MTKSTLISLLAALLGSLALLLWNGNAGRVSTLETQAGDLGERVSKAEAHVESLHEGQTRIEHRLESLDIFLRSRLTH